MSVLLRVAFFVGDIVFLNLSIILSYSLLKTEFQGDERINGIYLFIFSNLAWLFLIVVSNPYNVSRNWSISKVVKSQLSFIFIHLLVVASLIYFFRKSYAAEQIALMYLLFILTFFLWKLLALFVSSMFTRQRIRIKNMIIVGQSDLAREVRRFFLLRPELRYRFLRHFKIVDGGFPLTKIQRFCGENDIHVIYCCLPDVENVDVKRLIDFAMDSLIRVKLIADQRSFQQKSLELEQYDQIPVFNISTIPLDEARNQFLKRVFDIAFSSAMMIGVLSWLIPVVGLAIKIDSPGPIFFRQKRSGRNNQPFYCLKFRTMLVNAEADLKQATSNDSRVTRLGNFLRNSSIDEFPQFWNVLKGEMSTVGPRPHMLKHTEDYSKIIEKFMGRHYVKPGVTGLAQCMGYRGETKSINDMRNRIRLDRFYIENWSFYFDMKIIAQTIVSLIKAL